eukprot:s236_g3.t1
MDCRHLQEAFRLQLQQPPLRLPNCELLGPKVSCPLLEAHCDVQPAVTTRGDLCMVAVRSLSADTLLLREEPLAVSRCDPEESGDFIGHLSSAGQDSSYNMLLLLSTTAKHFEYLQSATIGLTPRRCLPKEGRLIRLQKASIPSKEDGREIASNITSFCSQQEDHEKAAEELLRLTVAFLLNSFAAASNNEVRLCRFCALFNHSCDPSATPETDGGIDPAAWPVERRQEFLSKSFGFRCNCHRCIEEAVPEVPRSVKGGWQPDMMMRWESAERMADPRILVLPLRPDQLQCDLAAQHLRLRAGDHEALIALPCPCVEAATARLARRRLLLTLKESEDASSGYASSHKMDSCSSRYAKEEAAHSLVGFRLRCYLDILQSYVPSCRRRGHRRPEKEIRLQVAQMRKGSSNANEKPLKPLDKAFAMSQPDSSRARAKSIGHYILGKTIGEGTFGKVKLGTHILTSERVAVKILEKERIVEVADVERVAREVHILKLIRHPHIVQLYEIIETRRQLYLIMEYASGGELFDYIVAKGRVPELEACRFFHQIIAGLEKVHAMNIVHRDLKLWPLLSFCKKRRSTFAETDWKDQPENLLLDEHKNIKIVDFGLSNVFRQGQLLKTACGSPCYAAPEMIAGTGGASGIDQNTSALYKKILAADYKTPKFISESVRDLISKLLTTDPTRRYNVPDVRAHPWYCQIPEASTPVPDNRVEQGFGTRFDMNLTEISP